MMMRDGGWCRGSGSVVTWRRAQMVLLAAQGMDVVDDISHEGLRVLLGEEGVSFQRNSWKMTNFVSLSRQLRPKSADQIKRA
jgi:hypothetical protein